MSDFFKSKLRPMGKGFYSYHPMCECCGHAVRFFITKMESGRWRIEEERGGPFKYVDSAREAKAWIDKDLKRGGPMRRLRKTVKRWEKE